MESLISIIIPTYNRSTLISATLDSIILQTYQNWECIVVDDGSTDDTEQILNCYCRKDDRFKFYQRPGNKAKGANACRNFGVEKCLGEYIVFFDSDDLMTPEHLQVKYSSITKGDCDFVIAKTKYLNIDLVDELYDFEAKDINNHNYITQKINWLTYDTLIKRELATSISFNEELQSGQEFNYFAKLTTQSNNALLIDEYLTLRRYHEESIRAPLRINADLLVRSKFKAHWETYLDLKTKLEKRTRTYLMKRCIGFFFAFEHFYRSFSIRFAVALWRELGYKKAIYYTLANAGYLLFGKGYFFVKRVRSFN